MASSEALNRSKSREEDVLADYLAEVRRIPLLTPDEEIALARRIQAGDEKALEALVLGNLRFVVSMAKRYSRAGGSVMDLINEGNLALIRAAKLFNPDLGLRFISYAVWWIRKYIFHHVARVDGPMAIPERKAHHMFKISKARAQLRNTLRREPRLAEIAHEVNLPEDKVCQILRARENLLSLDGTSADFVSGLIDHSGEAALAKLEESYAHRSMSSELRRSMRELKIKEREALELYFGFRGGRRSSFEKIGKIINLSREGARRTVHRALEKLAQDPRLKQLEDAYLCIG